LAIFIAFKSIITKAIVFIYNLIKFGASSIKCKIKDCVSMFMKHSLRKEVADNYCPSILYSNNKKTCQYYHECGP
jgi:hypothetical protein